MNKLSEFSDSFDRYVSPKISFLNNEYVNAFLMIVLIAYASLAAPRLPENIVRLFDSPLTKLIVFFLIVYLAKHNAGVAIVAAIAVLVTLITLNKYNVKREMMSNLGTMEANLDKCNGWDCEKISGENGNVDNVEGNESEFTESGFPIDFAEMEHKVVETPKVQEMVQSEKHKELLQEVHHEVSSEMKAGKGIIASSISGVKNLLKKANIIEGYENSSSYSEF